MSEYTPTTDEGWALVDLLKDILEDAETQPKFTRDEHALMGAGQIRREWLAEHDAKLIERIANKWTQGAWANTPRRRDSVADRLASANYAGDWLREQAQEIRRMSNGR